MKNRINKIVLESIGSYREALLHYWPGWENNDASEKLLQQHVAIHFHRKGWLIYPEVTFGNTEKIDMVAIHPNLKTILCIESKRVYTDQIKGIYHDIDKIERFQVDANNLGKNFSIENKYGLILGSLWAASENRDPAFKNEWNKKIDANNRNEYWKKLVKKCYDLNALSNSEDLWKGRNKDYNDGWAKWIIFESDTQIFKNKKAA